MELSSNLILLTKHYMGDLTHGFDGLCFERPERDGSTNPRLSILPRAQESLVYL